MTRSIFNSYAHHGLHSPPFSSSLLTNSRVAGPLLPNRTRKRRQDRLCAGNRRQSRSSRHIAIWATHDRRRNQHRRRTPGPFGICTLSFVVSVSLLRLIQWEETQDNLKLTMQRNIYGMHAPMRLMMERKIVSAVSIFMRSKTAIFKHLSQNPHMPALPQSNLHLDILMGRDESIGPADVFGGTLNASASFTPI